MEFKKKSRLERRGLLKKRTNSGISGTPRSLPRKKTNQNKYELRIAEELGGQLTAGSGAVFSDGDIRAGGFLIEHKARNCNTISLHYRIWEKIRHQALQRNLIPALVLSFIGKKDLVILDPNDVYEIYQQNKIVYIKQTTHLAITVSLPEFENEANDVHISKGCDVIPIKELRVASKDTNLDKSLYVTYLSDFKRYAF